MSAKAGTAAAGALLPVLCLQTLAAASVPALLFWQHKHLCGCRNSSHFPEHELSPGFCQSWSLCKNKTGTKAGWETCTLKLLLFCWKSGAAFGADSLEGQRAAVPLEMCAKTSLYFLADKIIIGPSVAEIEGAGLGRYLWSVLLLWSVRIFGCTHPCLAVVNHILDW